MGTETDIKAGRLPHHILSENFCDKTPPLNLVQAKAEASRCYFCYDAPCIQACPTDINIPSFIKKISTDNLKGSAVDILSQNIMGGTCARVCPVETLCESACVRNKAEDKPVTIGQLQRYATDWLFENKIQPFKREKPSGKTVAVIGAGPAGLSCAHRLAILGHNVVVFEAKQKAGGLNEYGLAAYKVVDEFVQREIDFILSIGGIQISYGKALGRDISLKDLKSKYDAVFLGVGLGGTNQLGLENENVENVIDAIDYIAKLRQSKLAELPVGRKVVVIGGGNTAIDIAVQTKLLGAEDVTLAYRRGPEEMPATWKEQELAQKNGVLIRHWMRPTKIHVKHNKAVALDLESTELQGGQLKGSGRVIQIPCDVIFKAIGQVLKPEDLGDTSTLLKIENGKVQVVSEFQTSLKGVFAGGDCINKGSLTVQAVQDGKLAAIQIDQFLRGKSHG